MESGKGLSVLLTRVLIEDDFRPNALQGRLQVRGAKPDHCPFPTQPSYIAILDGSFALKPRQEDKRAFARNDTIEGKTGKNVEPRRSDLRNKLLVLNRLKDGIDVAVPHA